MFFVDSVSDWKTPWGHLRDSDRVAQKCLVLAMRWSSTNPRNMGSARVIKGEGRGEKRGGVDAGSAQAYRSAIRHTYCLPFQLTS